VFIEASVSMCFLRCPRSSGMLLLLVALLSSLALPISAAVVVASAAVAEAPRPRKHFLQPPGAVALLQEDSYMGRSSVQATLAAGSHVRLKGLVSTKDLNGRQGTIQAYDPYSGRYVITMTSGGPSKRVRPGNVELLELSEINDDPVSDGDRFHHGARVTVFGLRGLKALNGKTGTIRHFDFGSGRYDVEIPGEPPKRIRPENLRPAGKGESHAPSIAMVDHHSRSQQASGSASVCQSSAGDAGPNGWPAGTKVRFHGLQSATARPWNGLVGVVHCFLAPSQRYVVALPDGTPRMIKPHNLELPDGSDAAPQSSGGASDSGSGSICKTQGVDTAGFQGPGGLRIGDKVILHGLKSASALKGHWNGLAGVVHCFDRESQRYVVKCSDGAPRKLKQANLMSASGGHPGGGSPSSAPGSKSICQQQATKGFVGPGGLAIGAKVRLHGLKSAGALKGHWNGMVGVVHCFVVAEQRFVVSCPDGAPRKLKLANLQKISGPNAAAAPQADSEGAPQAGPAHKSICQPQEGPQGPGGLAVGTKVAIFGLTSKAAINGRWNGMVGVMHCYDAKSLRYVVAMSDGSPRRLKIENLAIVTNAVTQPKQSLAAKNSTLSSQPKKVQWLKGAYVRLVGLQSAAELNGQVGSVVGYENTTQRYVIQVPGVKRLKRIRVNNLADVASSEPTVAPPVVAAIANVVGNGATPGVQKPQSGRQLSVCNAYATHSPIQVFAVSGDGKNYTHVVKDLDFQACSDIDSLPSEKVGALAFILGKFQVAKKTVDFATLTPGQGMELVVFRKDPNSLQAVVNENPIEIGDSEAYYVHVVNAYAGSRHLELRVQRGKFLQKLPLDRTFRLSTTKAINMVLSDGTQKLRLNFQPRRSKTYTIMATGVDQGLRGEPRNVGLVAHEIGAWTSSEEMVNPDGSDQAEPAPAPEHIADKETGKEAESSGPAHSGSSFGLVSVLGRLFSGTRAN